MITLEQSKVLQLDLIDLCCDHDVDEELTNDLYQVVTKHYEEAILWEVWEKTYYKTFGEHLVKPKVWKYHLDGVLQNNVASPSLRSEADGQRDK